MTSILLSCICAVALGAASPSSRADTTDVYVIDYVDVKDFNGTQLVGKTISTYNINLAGNGSRTVRRHTIKTVLSGNTVKDGTGEMSSETAGLFRSTPEGKDTTNVFIIDNVVVKGFNGFQLNGKTISAYEISLTDTGARMVRTHMIPPLPSPRSCPLPSPRSRPLPSPLPLPSLPPLPLPSRRLPPLAPPP